MPTPSVEPLLRAVLPAHTSPTMGTVHRVGGAADPDAVAVGVWDGAPDWVAEGDEEAHVARALKIIAGDCRHLFAHKEEDEEMIVA